MDEYSNKLVYYSNIFVLDGIYELSKRTLHYLEIKYIVNDVTKGIIDSNNMV